VQGAVAARAGGTNRADDGFPGQLAFFVSQAGGRIS
jgi:hypothetical protein